MTKTQHPEQWRPGYSWLLRRYVRLVLGADSPGARPDGRTCGFLHHASPYRTNRILAHWHCRHPGCSILHMTREQAERCGRPRQWPDARTAFRRYQQFHDRIARPAVIVRLPTQTPEDRARLRAEIERWRRMPSTITVLSDDNQLKITPPRAPEQP